MGWGPNVVLTTNISQIELALEGKIDFVRKTNPFGGGEESEEEKLKHAPPNSEMAMKQLVQMAKRRQVRDARFKKKPKEK